MNIKIRLSLQFTFIVAIILLFFSALVYYFSYSSQLDRFRQNLYDRAKNTATLLINVTEVDSTLLKKIQQSSISWEREELVITDTAFNLIYMNNIQYLSDKVILLKYASGNLHYFSFADKDGVFYKHFYEGRPYYVFIMAVNKSRIESLSDLRRILFWSILFSIWLSVLFSYLFSRRAIKPISKIIRNVKEINSLQLNRRLDEGNRKDEIDQLAITFNEMLTNLEIAFKNQEDFIANASHELRTPLTVMISESDYFLNRERNKEEYISHISGLVDELKKLNSIINGLLELAQIKRDRSIIFSDVRIDEIVFNIIHQVRAKYQGRKIVPKIQYPENENDLLIKGDSGILEIAFKNLIDNAFKFSNEDVVIEFQITDNFIDLIITDKGIGIPSDEIENICKPFTRASNVKFIGGFGIGLYLVSKIMELHDAKLSIDSKINEGTRIIIHFKRSFS
jgi:signal transduction histidine kinase